MNTQKASAAAAKETHERNKHILGWMKLIVSDNKHGRSPSPLNTGQRYDPFEEPAHKIDLLAKYMIVDHDGDGYAMPRPQSPAEQTASSVRPGSREATGVGKTPPVIRYTPPGSIHKIPLARQRTTWKR
jgi:hypothetical protein